MVALLHFLFFYNRHCHLPFSWKWKWECSIAPFINFVMAFEHRKLRHLICYALWFLYSERKERTVRRTVKVKFAMQPTYYYIHGSYFSVHINAPLLKNTNHSWIFCIVYHSITLAFITKGHILPLMYCINSIYIKSAKNERKSIALMRRYEKKLNALNEEF